MAGCTSLTGTVPVIHNEITPKLYVITSNILILIFNMTITIVFKKIMKVYKLRVECGLVIQPIMDILLFYYLVEYN